MNIATIVFVSLIILTFLVIGLIFLWKLAPGNYENRIKGENTSNDEKKEEKIK